MTAPTPSGRPLNPGEHAAKFTGPDVKFGELGDEISKEIGRSVAVNYIGAESAGTESPIIQLVERGTRGLVMDADDAAVQRAVTRHIAAVKARGGKHLPPPPPAVPLDPAVMNPLLDGGRPAPGPEKPRPIPPELQTTTPRSER